MDREKVIKALTQCLRGNDTSHCDGCPYNSKDFRCRLDLRNDAIELLKAQEPRVMTLEEVVTTTENTIVWYEHIGKNMMRPRIVSYADKKTVCFTDGGVWNYKKDGYGKRFRFWTSRPTAEQREAVKWDA